jgi:hypothetical protein
LSSAGVDVSAYVASTIADERPMAGSVTAVKIGVVAFLLPFAFVYNPGLLLIGIWETALFDITKVTVGVLIFASVAADWYYGILSRWSPRRHDRGRTAVDVGLGYGRFGGLLIVGGYLFSRRFFP